MKPQVGDLHIPRGSSAKPGCECNRPHQSWLLLAMASTLAGNLTITGSIANIIVVERARSEVAISFRDYLRVGVPVTLATLAFGTVWLWWVRLSRGQWNVPRMPRHPSLRRDAV